MKIWKKSLQVERVHLEFIGNASRYIQIDYFIERLSAVWIFIHNSKRTSERSERLSF